MNTVEDEILEAPMFSEEMGPAQSIYPGFFKIRVNLDGSRISTLVAEAGYLKRNVEKRLSETPWPSLPAVVGKINGESPVFAELAMSLAIEKLLKIEISDRSSYIRMLICELSRISSHLRFLSNMGRSVGQINLFHYALRDREAILDLLELVSGSRYGYGFLRVGGVSTDVTEGFVERVLEFIEMMNFRLKEYNDLFTYNHVFTERAQLNGMLSLASVKKHGVTGPNARSVGLPLDFRKFKTYCNYELVDFEVPLGVEAKEGISDIHERMIVRLREIAVSIGILKQVLEVLPSGQTSWVDTRNSLFPDETVKVSVESPMGELAVEVFSQKNREKPRQVKLSVPSRSNFFLLPEIAINTPREDLALLVCSLDLSIAEVDL